MTRIKHVLVILLLILPMFALAPSLVASPNEVLTNRAPAESMLPAQFVEETLRVAVYAEDDTSLPSYATGGVYTDFSANVISLLESEDYAVTALTTQDILDHKLMVANFDTFVLVNQLPKDDIVNLVKDYWLGGGGILCFEASIGYAFYAGLIDESLEGDFELAPIAVPGSWGYSGGMLHEAVVNERHPVTKTYDVGDEFLPSSNNITILNGIDLPGIVGDEMRNLVTWNETSLLPIVTAFDDPTRGGKIIHISDNCSTIPTWEEPIITDAIDWLAPRPKAHIAIDYTHVPFYGVDSWDENVSIGGKFEIWRDSVVNHSSTFDKLYPTHGEELTADDLSPFDVLIINMPSINYTAAEITVIRTWVQNGGGLYLVGENTVGFLDDDQRIESIIDGLGITFYVGSYTGVAESVSDFEAHPLFEGVSSFEISAGSYLNVSAPAYPVAYFDSSDIAMAGRDYGEGRILVIADVNHFDPTRIIVEDNYQLGINVINWLSSGTAKVLVYADSSGVSIHPNFVPLNGPVAKALNDLGIPFYMTSDKDYFNMSLFAEDWDLVILDNTNYNTRDYQPHLIDFVADGGKLIISTYSIDATTGAYFGVQANNSIGMAPPTVYLWEQDHSIFNLPAAYGETNLNSSLDLSFGTYAINFTTYANATPLAGYTAAHAGAAIVIGAGGNAIVNGPLLTVYNEDTDDSTYSDNQEIWENEIAFLYFDRPTIDHPDDVTYMETETGNEFSWTATADAGAWEYVFSANGTTVESGRWTGSALTFNVDGVNASITEYELTVFDRLGYSVSDLVSLNVTEYVEPATTDPGGGAPLDPTLLLIIGGAVAGVVILLIVIMQFKKKK